MVHYGTIRLQVSSTQYKSVYAVREESKGMPTPYQYVVSWFKATFPKYGKLPEHNTDMQIVNTPEEYEDIA